MTDKIKSENFLSSDMQDGEIDIGQLFRFLLMQSKLIISIVSVVFVLSFILYSQSTKQYLIKSLIQYEAFDQNVFNPFQALQSSSSMNSSSDISNMVELYESRTNYLRVIKDLKLNIEIEGLNDGEKIDLDITSNGDDLLQTHAELKLSFSNTGYSLLDGDLNEIQTSQYGQQISFEELDITVNSVNMENFRTVDINFKNPESMFNSFKTAMDVSTNTSRNSFFKNDN